jgi:chromosome segregation ATPase
MADKHDIQHSILELQAKRSKLGVKKQHIQGEINKIREMLKYIEQGHDTFNDLVAKKNTLVSDGHEIDTEIADLKSQIKKRQLLREEVSAIEQPKAMMLEAELTVLRDYYLSFAGDKTRVASMRAMSAEFAGALTTIIKKTKIAA